MWFLIYTKCNSVPVILKYCKLKRVVLSDMSGKLIDSSDSFDVATKMEDEISSIYHHRIPF